LEDVKRDSHTIVNRDWFQKIGRDQHLEIDGKTAVRITGSTSLSVNGDVVEEFHGNHSSQVSQDLYLKAMQIVIEAAMGITLKVGGNFITIDKSGIAIRGLPMVQINSGGAALSGSAASLVSPVSPLEPAAADNADPGAAAKSGSQQASAGAMSALAIAPSDAPSHDPNSSENKGKEHWIEIELVDEDGNSLAGEPYRITLPNGTTVASGTLDNKGWARVDHIDAGTCQVTFPNLDKDAWAPR
jgi:type VI secretion system secreted protein VgrG